jgi:hypothetical protein
VLNHHILGKLDFRGIERFQTWEARNPEWGEQIQAAFENSTL